MSMNINFKDKIRRGIQQEQQNQQATWNKQPNLIKNGSKKDLFKTATNILTSQQFEPGDFRRPSEGNNNNLPKKRNSSILEMECQEDFHQQQMGQMGQVQQNYYNGAGSQRGGPASMLNSNGMDNYSGSLFQSKLHQTKGELAEQIQQVQKRIKKQIQRDRGLIQDYINRLFTKFTKKQKQDHKQNLRQSLEQIVLQLNTRLQSTSKKHKALQTRLTDNQDQLSALMKQFSQFTLQTEQKIEKIINSSSNANADVANSMKKSLSRNMGGGDYVVQLKNSIKDIPVISPVQLIDQIRQEIQETQQAIRSMKLQISSLRQDVKVKIITTSITQPKKQNPQYIQSQKLTYIADQLTNIKSQLQNLQSTSQTQHQSLNRYKQLRSILQIQQQNWIGINETFHKSVNNNIIPRLKKTQQQCQSLSAALTQNHSTVAESVKKQVIKQLDSMPILRVKAPTAEEKEKLERMKGAEKGRQTVYMLDEGGFVLDCFGRYLVGDGNQRVRLEEEQIYYLEQVEGIQVKIPSY